MARRCEICGKGTVAGNSVPRKGQAKKHGGVGQHIGVTTKRVFRPNLVSVKTLIKGTPRTIKVCTRCLRSGKVEKLV
ncbi:MAG: 50S ribosomal protein L28 [Sphaerochaetaceae bacterium]